MRKNFLLTFFVILIVAGMISGCRWGMDLMEDDSKLCTVEQAFVPNHAFVISGAFHVTVEYNQTDNSCTLTATEKQLESIEVSSLDGVLNARFMNRPTMFSKTVPELKIRTTDKPSQVQLQDSSSLVMNEIDDKKFSVDLDGSCRFELTGGRTESLTMSVCRSSRATVCADALDASLSAVGSSRISFSGNGEKVKIECCNSSRANVNGNYPAAVVIVANSSRVDVMANSETAEVSIQNSSRGEVFAGKEISGFVKNSSRLTICGGGVNNVTSAASSRVDQ